ncbi:MAG: 3-deoxy-7-phosphoheptulonate synthase [Armatimonadetes bacterium]|nr:MAG: 3-deoxy-7-phosphoheptulonate synthase [Armatimonadota bacterium]
MIIEFRPDATRESIERVRTLLLTEGCDVSEVQAGPILLLVAERHWAQPPLDIVSQLKAHAGVADVRGLGSVLPRVGGASTKPVEVRGFAFGGDELGVIAGPCTVESEEQLAEIARFLVAQGVRFLRGGAFKPTTSPYSYPGGREEALRALQSVRREFGVGVVTEVMTPEQVPMVAEVADVLQIGARNMQNFDLLREAGQSGKPILLKRGFGCTVEEWLHAAEHIAITGNGQILLCERGIRSFDPLTRASLDVSGIAVARTRTHLPILADPSHAAGRREFVKPLALAAIGAGAMGLMVEIHPDPESAVKDGAQTLNFEQFTDLLQSARAVWRALKPEQRAER